MSPEQSERDRLTHLLLSPLTTLQGATSLLQRRLHAHEDAAIAALLGALERGTARLTTLAELLLRNARVRDETVLIELPLDTLHAFAPAAGADPSATRERDGHALPGATAAQPAGQAHLLVIAGPESAATAVGELLRARGHQVSFAAQSERGVDLARTVRPTLVLLDPALDERGELARHVLEEDPDTKGMQLAVMALEPSPTAGQQALSLAPNLAPEQAAEMLEHVLAGGARKQAQRPHILIVDDEPEIAGLMALQFTDEGYQITTVQSGTELLRIVRERQFGLILLDLMLPDISGFTALGGLRAQPETQLTPIILVSAIDSPAEKVRGLQLGADDYITKPFSAAELSARVQAALRRSEREGGANPSTRLPGNVAIERAITQRIAERQPFAVCYGDLDHFKAYNDSYGFLKGDAVIQRTAQILLDAVRAEGNPDDFVGHIGGDDFVVLTTPDRAGPICTAASAQFDETAPLFYDAETRAAGFISGVDRLGRPTAFPLVSITFAVVSSARQPFTHPGEVAQRAAEAKKRAKLIPGSIFLVEE